MREGADTFTTLLCILDSAIEKFPDTRCYVARPTAGAKCSRYSRDGAERTTKPPGTARAGAGWGVFQHEVSGGPPEGPELADCGKLPFGRLVNGSHEKPRPLVNVLECGVLMA